jgi:hypothetical protein
VDRNELVAAESLREIERWGNCAGKYRILLDDGYYCFLEGVRVCNYQVKCYVPQLNTTMLQCEFPGDSGAVRPIAG